MAQKEHKRSHYEDRVRLETLIKTGMNTRKIADLMGIHLATLYRELSRSGASSSKDHYRYSAIEAQKTLF